MDLVGLAREVVDARFPTVRAAVLAGSAGVGRAGPLSDLDVVVVLDGPPAPYRETFRTQDRPVELFVHTEASVAYWFERESRQGICILAHMLATGRALTGADVDLVRAGAQAHLDAGPPAWTQEEVDYGRYSLTDALDDLAAARDADERDAVAGHVLAMAIELRLATARAWRGRGKWMVRRLRECDPHLARQLMEGHRAAVGTGDVTALSAACDQVLGPLGGRLTEGYLVRSTPT